MLMDFTWLFTAATDLARNDPYIPNLVSQAAYDAAKRVLGGIAGNGTDTFDQVWQKAATALAEREPGKWDPFKQTRLLGIKGAFAEGRVACEEDLRRLVAEAGLDPDCAPRLVSELASVLREALLETARDGGPAFAPAVLDALKEQEVLSQDQLEELRAGHARQDQAHARQDQDHARMADELVSLRAMLTPVAQRLQDLQGQALPTPYEFSAEEKDIFKRAQGVLERAPSQIASGAFRDAELDLLACRRDLGRLSDALRKHRGQRPQHAAVAALLARADLQLGTIAFERGQFRRAADIYNRGSEHARGSEDTSLRFHCCYSVGLAYAYARDWRLALPWFEDALELRPADLDSLSGRAVALAGLGRPRDAVGIYRDLLDARRSAGSGASDRSRVAATLNNLGNALRDLGDRAGAKAAYEEAWGIYSEFEKRYPGAFTFQLQVVGRNLANLK